MTTPSYLPARPRAARTSHFSIWTGKACIGWIRRHIAFTERGTRWNQALSALLFLYRVVLNRELKASGRSCGRAVPGGSRWC